MNQTEIPILSFQNCYLNLQESSFCYDPAESAASSKQINHDVLYREGKTITVSCFLRLGFNECTTAKIRNLPVFAISILIPDT